MNALLGILAFVIVVATIGAVDVIRMRKRGGAPIVPRAHPPTFTCARCGSHFFRTEHVPDVGDVGICRGAWIAGGNYAGCEFRWNRETEDTLYFEADVEAP